MKLFNSIRGKLLFWFLVIAVIPAELTGLFGYRISQNMLKKYVYDQLSMEAEIEKKQIDSYLKLKKSMVIGFSSDGFIRDSTEKISQRDARMKHYTTSLNNHLITNKKSLDPEIISVFVTNFDGKVIASTNQDHIGKDVSGKNYFTKAGFLEAFASGPQSGIDTEELAHHFSTMLLNKIEREPIGIIINQIRFKKKRNKERQKNKHKSKSFYKS